MRKAGKRRMVTGLSTSWLDLDKSEETLQKGFSGNWRNMLRAGQREKLKITLRDDGKGVGIHLSAYNDFRKQKRFVGPPGGLIEAMANNGRKGDIITINARTDQHQIAGILLICHGNSATYYTSWNSEPDRAKRAHNVLLWRAIHELQKRNIK